MLDARAVADAFALGRPLGPPRPYIHNSAKTFTLDTDSGRWFVKSVPEAFVGGLATAMAFEQRAAAAGVDMPRPVPPVPGHGTVGLAAPAGNLGLVRVYEFADGRPLGPGDDCSVWLGGVLARIHSLVPLREARPEVYGIHPPSMWERWADEGTGLGLAWAPVLRRRLADVTRATEWIAGAFADAADYVLAHRDVEPWNVLITGSGPILVDWDTAGPDSAGLVAGHAAFSFGCARTGTARPDLDLVRRVLTAYAEAGGGPLPGGDTRFARRAGIMLSRSAERIAITLGRHAVGAVPAAQLDQIAADRIDALPAFIAGLRASASR